MNEPRKYPKVEVEIYSIGPNGLTRLDNGESPNANDTLSPFFSGSNIESLIGTLFSRNSSINLGSAHFKKFNLPKTFPESEIDWLNDLTERINENETPNYRDLQRMTSFKESMVQIWKDETSLNVSGANAYHTSTRAILDEIFYQSVSLKGKTLALPLPSWHFWDMGEDYRTPQVTGFNARSESELVDNFNKVAKKDNVGALVLVNPANPLQYKLSESAAKSLDKTALKYGISIIVDDVLRGTLPIGERDSIARWFTNPDVVEGLSKRFGEGPLSNFSIVSTNYAITPKKDKAKSEIFDNIVGTIISLAFKYSSVAAIDELRNRNEAFDQGIKNTCGEETTLVRSCPSSLTTLIDLGNNSKLDGYDFSIKLMNRGVLACPMNCFYPDHKTVPNDMKNLFRITIGRHDPDDLRSYGEFIGRGISYECFGRS